MPSSSTSSGAATVYTVGHGTRATPQLAELVRASGVGRIVDVRRFPVSRRHPHFTREALEHSLPGMGIDYQWRGGALGGRRSSPRGLVSRHGSLRVAAFRSFADHMDTDEFRAALDDVVTEAQGTPALAIMCAETLWWRCHRRLISDALVLRGVHVIHLIQPGTAQAHLLHDAVRADDDGRPVYDVGTTATLM